MSTSRRLVDMGVDPYLVASSVTCVAAERLARELCTHCRQPADVSMRELQKLGLTEADCEGATLYKPNLDGCARCHGGYSGRFAIVEALTFNEELRKMVLACAPSHELQQVAVANGMETLRRTGLLNFVRGRTSLEEVLRVTVDDGSRDRGEAA